MASRRNPQQAPISSAASGNVTVFTNPSTTAFAYVWEFYLVAGGTANLTLQNGSAPLTGPMPVLASSVIDFDDEGGGFPRFVINPGQSFIVNDSAGVQKSGYVTYSN